jgi:hypothetical protein
MILELASEWHVPPWEIAGEDATIWYMRWMTKREIYIKVQESKTQNG